MFGEGLPKAPLRWSLSYACPHPLDLRRVCLHIDACTTYPANIHMPCVVLCERDASRKDCSRQYGYSRSVPPRSEASHAGPTLFEGLSSPSTTFTTVNTMPRHDHSSSRSSNDLIQVIFAIMSKSNSSIRSSCRIITPPTNSG